MQARYGNKKLVLQDHLFSTWLHIWAQIIFFSDVNGVKFDMEVSEMCN